MHELTNNIIQGLTVTQLENETGISKKGYCDLLLNEVITSCVIQQLTKFDDH